MYEEGSGLDTCHRTETLGTFVNTVMNLWTSQETRNFLTAEQLIRSQKEQFSIVSVE
jgi:hypothetical protein